MGAAIYAQASAICWQAAAPQRPASLHPPEEGAILGSTPKTDPKRGAMTSPTERMKEHVVANPSRPVQSPYDVSARQK